MIVITKGTTGQTLLVTLEELRTLEAPYYWFVFTNAGTSDVIQVRYFYSADTSSYPTRVNEFTLDETLFDTAATGQYLYEVYETENDDEDFDNIDSSELNLIENGRMVLNPATEINRNGYNANTENNTRKGYDGRG